MKRNRCFSVAMIAVLLLSLTACSHAPQAQPDPTATTTTSVTAAPTTATTVTEPATTVTTEAPTTTASVAPSATSGRTYVTTRTTRTYVTRTLPTTVSGTRPTRPIIPGEPPDMRYTPEIDSSTTPMVTAQNFGGKTFTFADYGARGTISEAQIDAFETAYNAKLTVDYIPTDTYLEELAAARAAGKLYDIIRLSSSLYPAPITADLLRPLETHISKGDLWNATTKSGFSWNLMYETSLSGHVYTVGGNYRQALSVIYYNKKEFTTAGYTGKNDPLALYNAGKWDWQTLYDMLLKIQRPTEGVYGINSPIPHGVDQFLTSYNTGLTKTTADGRFVENLSDPNIYEAYEMLQTYCYGEHKVINLNDADEPIQEQFLSGTTVALLSDTTFYGTAHAALQDSSTFGGSANLGVVPLPTYKNGPHSIWEWDGFGSGAYRSEEGVQCALAFAKHDSAYNHTNAYHTAMPNEVKALFCRILDSDHLLAPYNGFGCSAGSLGNLSQTLATTIALNDQNITVVLKGYKKVTQIIIDTALKP